MKIVLHIGQAKTGTTAIQRAFRKNDQELLRQGFLYPACAGGLNHALLTVPILGRVQRALAARIGADYEAGLERSEQAWAEVGAEARRTAPNVVILSSEFLFSAKNIEQIPYLVERHFGPDMELEFLAYLRTPSDYYVSAIQQKLKASCRLPPVGNLHLDQLERFSRIGKVVVRKFSRTELIGGDIVIDACSTLGIDSRRFSRHNWDANTSISAEGIILLQRYRRKYHSNNENIFTEDTDSLLMRIVREEQNNPNLYTKPKLKAEFAQTLDKETSSMKKIRTDYGLDLSKDHGISAADERHISDIENVEDLIEYDPDLLERLSNSCAVSVSVTSS